MRTLIVLLAALLLLVSMLPATFAHGGAQLPPADQPQLFEHGHDGSA